MTKKLFIALTDHDPGNSYLRAYSQEIIAEAENRNWHVEKAEGKDNNPETVRSRLANKPSLVVLNGHGDENEVLGYKNEVILSTSDVGLLKGSVSFIRACGCLNGFGKQAAKKGARAVASYRGDFWISRVNEYGAKPLQDPSAKPVLEASNVVALKLLKGASVAEAVSASKRKANEAILGMLTREEPYDSPALKALISNNRLLDFEGEGTATAYPE